MTMSSLGEALGYIAFGNPISQTLFNTTSSLLSTSGLIKASAPPVAVRIPTPWQLAGWNHEFVRLAGVSGAAAIIMSAYGNWLLGGGISDVRELAEARDIFGSANRYHIFHTCALLTVPLAHYPLLTGALLTAGILLFSGPLYYRALTGAKVRPAHLATYGGFCLIAAWLTFLF